VLNVAMNISCKFEGGWIILKDTLHINIFSVKWKIQIIDHFRHA
jgi:hypothetical protein